MFPVPKDLQRLHDEIDGWLDLRCPEKAVELLPSLLARPDARPAGLALRVRAAVATKQHQDAVRDLTELRATSYDPEWLDLVEAWCRKRLQDLPGAVQCMEQMLERNPQSAIGHFNLGCYLALAGDRERALDEVTLACGLDATFREMLQDEPDLDTLRRDARFQQLLVARGIADVDPAAGAEDDPELTDLDDLEGLDDLEELDDDDVGDDDPGESGTDR